jgi:predicted RNase H-like HicB family nuclease
MNPRFAHSEFVLLPYGLTVRFEPGEDGYMIASCVQLPGCLSQGKTLPEAVENIREAVLGYMALLEEDRAPRTPRLVYTSTCETFTSVTRQAESWTSEPGVALQFEYASA